MYSLVKNFTVHITTTATTNIYYTFFITSKARLQIFYRLKHSVHILADSAAERSMTAAAESHQDDQCRIADALLVADLQVPQKHFFCLTTG